MSTAVDKGDVNAFEACAKAGARRSKKRIVPSPEHVTTRSGWWGEKSAGYTHAWCACRVVSERGRSGLHLGKNQGYMRRRVIRVIYQEAGCIPLLRYRPCSTIQISLSRGWISLRHTAHAYTHAMSGWGESININTCCAYSHRCSGEGGEDRI